MTTNLHIGDEAIIFGLAGELRRFNGTRCTVLSENIGSATISASDGHFEFVDGYRVETVDGPFIVKHVNLRRPRYVDRVMKWTDCAWMPEEMRA